ncbi:chorismate mutase [Pseudonocardia nematodicida]|uniref:Chorismate mutase n=1 Tax=Pseudonocardia nematodicida TaxID=1206997 RepID=A0ABV1KJA4_9PSEU
MIGTRVHPPRRRARTATRTAGAVVLVALLAGCGNDQPAPLHEGTPGAAPADGLARIVDLAAERAEMSDRVAAAAFAAGAPAADPAREAAVVAGMREEARRADVDPEWAARVAGDQVAAEAQVRDALVRGWTDRPDTAPAGGADPAAPDPEIDRIDGELVAALRTATPARAHEDCASTLAQAAVTRARGMDDLHRAALGAALRSVCDGAGD